MDLVSGYRGVIEGIHRYNSDLERAGEDPAARRLAELIPYHRVWYYDPASDLAAPSKFIGYAGMTAEVYIKSERSLDGRQTEPRLKEWFRLLEEGSPEAAFVRGKVEALCSRYYQKPNRAVRFAAPIGWKAPGKAGRTPPGRRTREAPGRHTIHATITRGDSYFVAECDQLAVVTQGRTVDETLHNLKEAISLHLDGEDLAEFGLVSEPIVLVTMELLPWVA